MKTTLLKTVFALLFVIVFNILFFLLCGTNNPTSVWISYGFVHVAYFTILVIPAMSSKGQDSFYLNAVLYNQAIAYFLLELVLGIVCIIWAPEKIVWPLVIQSVLWVIYATILIGNSWANEVTEQSLAKRTQDITPFMEMVSELKKVTMMINDHEINTEATKIYEALYYSGSRQTSATIQLDSDISNLINAVKVKVRQGDENCDEVRQYLKKLSGLIEERKVTLKYSH